MFALFLSFSITTFAAEREKDIHPVKKTDVTKQQTTPITKSTPTTQVSPQQEPITPSTSDTRADEQINWQVLSSGGGISTVGSLILGSTIGQTVAGQSTIGDLTLNSGFQQNFETESELCCNPPIRGNIDYDVAEIIDISDLMYLIDFMFLSGPAPVCFEEADVNASGTEPLDISDLVWLIDYMFIGGPPPFPCQ
jgi:hypothetical protein